jgi:hypothetical protein
MLIDSDKDDCDEVDHAKKLDEPDGLAQIEILAAKID